jgi:hypothetical protein
VVDATVKTGIARQMEAFRAGFNQVILLHWILLEPIENSCFVLAREMMVEK